MSDADVERLEQTIRELAHAANNDLMTRQEAAAFLRISVHTLYKWSAKGSIPSEKHGGLLRFSRKALEAWRESHRRGM